MEIVIKEKLQTVRTEKLPKVALIAPTMINFFVQMKKLGYSHNASRIVLTLSANIKAQQMLMRSKTTPNQLNLFDEEWMEVDDNKSMAVQLTFKYKDFLPQGSKNYDQVKSALDELQEKSWLIQFEKNTDGRVRKYQLKSALISSYLAEEGNGFKLTINNYWYRALVNISESFNSFDTSLIYKLSFNAIIFYMYLKTLPIIKAAQYTEIMGKTAGLIVAAKGTKVKNENFLQMFQSNYIYESDIKRKILDPIIAELDNNADISAGYKFDNGCICLATYDPGASMISKHVNVEENKIKKAVNYKVSNNDLNGTQAIMMLEIYLKYTYDLVFKATQRKTILRGLKGQLYCDAFKIVVEKEFSKTTNFKGYEDITSMRSNLRKKYFVT